MRSFKQWAKAIGNKHLGGGEGIVVQVACFVACIAYATMACQM